MNNEVFLTKDKFLVAYLLTRTDIKYLGQEDTGSQLFFQFSPANLAEKIKTEFETETATPVQPIVLSQKFRIVSSWIGDWRNSTFKNKNENGRFYK